MKNIMGRTVSWRGGREAAGEDEGSGREGPSTPWEGAQQGRHCWPSLEAPKSLVVVSRRECGEGGKACFLLCLWEYDKHCMYETSR